MLVILSFLVGGFIMCIHSLCCCGCCSYSTSNDVHAVALCVYRCFVLFVLSVRVSLGYDK
ncbi:hypothetical protein BKA57DRAFT_463955 [Linnemannia elongata]|nr:hypothetical protein BKA57DRAFT_463955 [Linnemannia elongata]